MTELSELYPTREIPKNLIKVPTFLAGRLKDAVLPIYQKLAGNNPIFVFVDTNNESARGSNVFIAGGINKVLEGSKFRVATPTDNIYKTIFPLVKDRFYTDLNALDVKEKKPDYKRNNGLWKKVIELAEQKLERQPIFPFRVQGFSCVPDETGKDYGARIVPADNFEIIEDDRLGLPSKTIFSRLEDNGVIIPDNNGDKRWYSLDNGLSGVCLGRSSDLVARGGDLGGSDVDGRVVVVDAVGVASEFSTDEYVKQIKETFDAKIKIANAIRDESLSKLEKL